MRVGPVDAVRPLLGWCFERRGQEREREVEREIVAEVIVIIIESAGASMNGCVLHSREEELSNHESFLSHTIFS